MTRSRLRDAQDFLFQNDWRPLSVGLLLHLHRLLFQHTTSPGGRFKSEDNLVVDRSADGSITARFRPVPAKETAFNVAELVDRYAAAARARQHHPVLLIGLFVLDLLVIHPFEDGNGRVSRALTNTLLIERGYTVSRYVSLEELIADSEDPYYQALLDSTHGWHDDEGDPWPWLRYFVGVLAAGYETFAARAAANRNLSITWNTVDPGQPVSWPTSDDFQLGWRHDSSPELTALQGRTLRAVELLEWTGDDLATGMVAAGFTFAAGQLTIYNALDENGLAFKPPGPGYRRHPLIG